MRYTVTEYTTAGGAKGLIASVPGSTVVQSSINFRAGYKYVDDYQHKYETAHLLEHMLYATSKRYPGPRELDYQMTRNGGYSNAFTSEDAITYVTMGPDFDWERMTGISINTIEAPNLTDEYFKLEKNIVRTELNDYLSDPSRVLVPLMQQRAGIRTMAYEDRLKIIDNVTLEDIKKHYQKTHTLANMRFIVAGDFSDPARLAKLKDKLDQIKLPAGKKRTEILSEVPHPTEPTLVVRNESPSIIFRFTLTVPRQLNPEERIVMGLLDGTLNGAGKSLIYGQARENGLVYDCWSGASTSKYYSTWRFGGSATTENLPKFFGLAIDELLKLKHGELSSEVFESTRTRYLGRLRMGLQTTYDLVDYLADDYFYDDKIMDYATQEKLTSSVEKDAAIELAKEFLNEKNLSLGLYGKTDETMLNLINAKLQKLFS